MQSEIKQIENQFEEFTEKVGILKGEYNTLLNQQNDSDILIDKLKKDEETYTKAVELLSLVQKVTRDKIKESFEMIVTHALNYIFESDKYSFHLVFGRRGNLQELNFAVQTPDKDEPYNPLDTDSGGVLNIISLALRIVLMEVATPKINGFIIVDEGFAHLSSDHMHMAGQFLKEVNHRFQRQIIGISHKDKMITDANKLIEVK
ncbi:MAG: hypothetical protein ACTSVV_10730 [Promethearchaeota archaeon]